MYRSTKAANGSQCLEDLIREVLDGHDKLQHFTNPATVSQLEGTNNSKPRQRLKTEMLSTVFENASNAPTEGINDQTPTSASLLTEIGDGALWRASYTKLSTVA